MAEELGVSRQTVLNWENTEHSASPGHGDVLVWAIVTGVAVEELDPEHPQAGVRWLRASSTKEPTPPDGGVTSEWAASGSNREPTGSRLGTVTELPSREEPAPRRRDKEAA